MLTLQMFITISLSCILAIENSAAKLSVVVQVSNLTSVSTGGKSDIEFSVCIREYYTVLKINGNLRAGV